MAISSTQLKSCLNPPVQAAWVGGYSPVQALVGGYSAGHPISRLLSLSGALQAPQAPQALLPLQQVLDCEWSVSVSV